MKKRNVKLLIVATMLLVCLTASAVLFTACNDKDIRSAYAEAQQNWYAAANKIVTDSVIIDGEIGVGEGASPVTLALSGYRAYLGEEWVMDYKLYAKGLEKLINVGTFLNGAELVLHRTADGTINVTVKLLGGSVSLPLSFAESVIEGYLPSFDFADNTFYDAGSISGSAEAYTISAVGSLGYILYQLAPVLSLNFGFDVLPMLESWLTLGDVSGSVSIEDGNLKNMTTSQDIELLLPNEDADFLAYNVDNFPDLVMEFFETHKLSIPIDTGGIALTLTINAVDEFAEGIGLSATVSSEADYSLLSSDATFEQIAEDYADHVGSVRV